MKDMKEKDLEQENLSEDNLEDISKDLEKTEDTFSEAKEATEATEQVEDGSDEADGDENPADSETDSDDKSKKKGLFGKKKDKKDEQIEELLDKNQRLMAEFQNFRNRTEKEKSAMYDMGAKAIIEKILPIVDNFERGIAMLSEEDLESSVGTGMNMIYKQLTTALTDMGVEVIETKDCEFNPELHNAVMHIDDEELGENVIAEEFQKGYKYHDSVVRHSMVKVAN